MSETAYFGRAWRLTVESPRLGQATTIQSTSWSEESLHVLFSINKDYYSGALWWAEFVIYNLNAATEQLFLQLNQGDTVTLAAGYQKGWGSGNNVLFKGQVWQPMWERENVTDFKVTLRCMVGLPFLMQNFVGFTQGPQATQSQIVQRMAKEAHNSFSIADSLSDLDAKYTTQLPRSKTVFGRPNDYFQQLAVANGFPAYFGENDSLHLMMKEIGEGAAPDIVYAPPQISNVPITPSTTGLTKQTLIGVPQQTQDGAIFQVLLDSDVQLGKVVKIDMSTIRQLAVTPNTTQFPPVLSQDQNYVVAGLRHVGDTRGEDWYTEITAVTPKFWLGLFQGKMVS